MTYDYQDFVHTNWQERFAEPLNGHLQSIRYRAGNFLVGVLADGSTVVGEDDPDGDDGPLTPGHSYEFHGEWVHHAKYGRNYKFGYYTLAKPTSLRGIVEYLVKFCPGIGRQRAQELWGRYRDDTVRVLRDEPEKIPVDLLKPTLATVASDALREHGRYQDVVVNLYALLAKRGFPLKSLLKGVVNTWGRKAPELIRADPWVLLTNDLPGCGFKRVDKLWLDLHPRQFTHWKRVAMACWYVIDSDTTGHTWFAVPTVGKKVMDFIPGCDPVHAIKVALRAGWLLKRVDRDGGKWLAAREAGNSERTLAEGLRRLIQWTLLPSRLSPAKRERLESWPKLGDGESGSNSIPCSPMPSMTRALPARPSGDDMPL